MLRCFFFQAVDGIRYGHVTGVQTCALPICGYDKTRETLTLPGAAYASDGQGEPSCLPPQGWPGIPGVGRKTLSAQPGDSRSEERRVGKECRDRERTYEDRKKTEKE